MAQLQGGPVPVKKLNDVAAEFPAWGADGRTIYWALGNALFSYNLDRAKVVEDSLKVVEKAKADSTKKAGAAADSLKRLQAKSDSLTKANTAVPDSIRVVLESLKTRATADSIAKARADSVKKAEAADTTKKKTEDKPGYKPAEQRVKVELSRDTPRGTVVLRCAGHPMKGKEILENADIVVKDNRSLAIGARGEVQVPGGAKIIVMKGKTIVPGFIDLHYHPQWLHAEIHQAEPWEHLATLAYGVTTTRDPQTATSDVLSYADRVESAPRSAPGLFHRRRLRDRERARSRSRADHSQALRAVLGHQDAQDVHDGQPPAAAVDHHGGEGAGHHAHHRGRARLQARPDPRDGRVPGRRARPAHRADLRRRDPALQGEPDDQQPDPSGVVRWAVRRELLLHPRERAGGQEARDLHAQGSDRSSGAASRYSRSAVRAGRLVRGE